MKKSFRTLLIALVAALALLSVFVLTACKGNESEPEPEQYTVTVQSAEHGTISATPTTAVKGTVITVTATPDNGYELATLTANGADIKSKKQFTMPSADVTVAGTFTKKEEKPDGPPQEDDDDDAAYTVSVNGLTQVDLDIDDTATLQWYVYKNSTTKVYKECEVVAANNNVTVGEIAYDSESGLYSASVTPNAKGTTVVTVRLKSDNLIRSNVTYNVTDSIFNQRLYSGASFAHVGDEENPYITLTEGAQAAVIVKEASTQFVFKFTLGMGASTVVPTSQSFGIASCLTPGGVLNSNSLWFGLEGTGAVGVYDAYIREFFDGWGSAHTDAHKANGYSNLATGNTDVEFVLVRDGSDYYYSIGGYYEKFSMAESHAEVQTYAGIYSQTVGLTITDFSYTSDEDDVADAIDEYYTERGVAAVVIQDTYSMTELVKGEEVTLSAIVLPARAAADATLEWELDKDEMTAGQEGTTITNEGKLTLADDAAGYVTVICKVAESDVSQSFRIEILQEPLLDSNDYITVKGGVILNDGETDHWSITFPTTRSDRNGISPTGTGYEDMYAETAYMAVLNGTYHYDYTLSFKFKNYTNKSTTPKFQVSLGAQYNNFYLVYNAGHFRFETRTRGTQADNWTRDSWFNTEWIEFNPIAEHSVEIAITDRGVYVVKLDGEVQTFYSEIDSVGKTNPTTLVRSALDVYDSNLPIKFATYGCALTVSDIKVENGKHETSYHNFYSPNQSYELSDDETSFTMISHPFSMAGGGWGVGSYGGFKDYKVYYTKTLDTNGYSIEYTAHFSGGMNDGKFAMRVGSGGNGYQIHVCNDILRGSGYSIEMAYDNNDSIGNFSGGTPIELTNNTVTIRVEVKNNKLRLIANNKQIREVNYATSNIVDQSEVAFYVFTQNDANNGVEIQVTDVTITGSDFTAKDTYELRNTAGSVNINIDYAENNPVAIPVAVYRNGALYGDALPEDYELEYVFDSWDEDMFVWDEEDHTICGSDSVEENHSYEATVTVMLKQNGVVIEEITYNVTVSRKATSNDVLTVKGGAVLNYTDDPNKDWSISFPESQNTQNGIASETRYEDAAYGANFKNTIIGSFAIEFTVSNYKVSGQEFPKLMISLGGTHNQFYVVYKPDNGFRIEAVAPRINRNLGYWEDDGWLTSAWVSDYDPLAENTFKIACVSGVYHVYRLVSEAWQEIIMGENGDFGSHTMGRNNHDYMTEQNVRMATNTGVSCDVSGIKLTCDGLGYFYHTTEPNITVNSADSVTLRADNKGWNSSDFGNGGHQNIVEYLSNKLGSNATLELDVTVPTANDAKFAVVLGGVSFYIENKMLSNGKLQLTGGNSWDTFSSININTEVSLHIKAVRSGAGITFTITAGSDDLKMEHTWDNVLGGDDATIRFFVFNENGDDANDIYTISGITVSNNA